MARPQPAAVGRYRDGHAAAQRGLHAAVEHDDRDPAQAIGPLTLELPPLQLDLVDRLGLAVADQTVSNWSAQPWVLFFALAIGLVLLATVLSMAVAAVSVLAFNFMASRFSVASMCASRRGKILKRKDRKGAKN